MKPARRIWALASAIAAGCAPDVNLRDERAPPAETGPGPPAGASQSASAAPDEAPPVLSEITVESTDCLRFHFRADERVTASLVFTRAMTEQTIPLEPPRSLFDVAVRPRSLPPDTDVEWSVRASDGAGHVTESPRLPLHLPPALAPVAISEILANPAGSEYTQEWIEISNWGLAPARLGGFIIEDSAGADTLPDVVLAEGARALVVPANYVDGDPADPAAPEGTLIIRVEGRLGRDGLSNDGEAVRLRDAAGNLVSLFGGTINTGAAAWNGHSVVRAPVDACDGPGAWSSAPQRPTPGF